MRQLDAASWRQRWDARQAPKGCAGPDDLRLPSPYVCFLDICLDRTRTTSIYIPIPVFKTWRRCKPNCGRYKSSSS